MGATAWSWQPAGLGGIGEALTLAREHSTALNPPLLGTVERGLRITVNQLNTGFEALLVCGGGSSRSGDDDDGGD